MKECDAQYKIDPKTRKWTASCMCGWESPKKTFETPVEAQAFYHRAHRFRLKIPAVESSTDPRSPKRT